MSVGSIGSSATWNVGPAGSSVDPAARQAQVNAQADTLSQLMGTKHNTQVAANITDGKGVDLYLQWVTGPLTRLAISDAVVDVGCRLILGTLRTTVPVGSIGQAAEVAARCTAVAAGDEACVTTWQGGD